MDPAHIAQPAAAGHQEVSSCPGVRYGPRVIFLLAMLACSSPPAPEPVEDDAIAVFSVPQLGPLSGLTVYVSAGHGYAADAYATGYQRTVAREGIIEDVWTGTLATDLLVPQLTALGATVRTARERDRSPYAEQAGPVAVSGVSHHEWPMPFGTWDREAPVARLFPGGTAQWSVSSPSDASHPLYVRWIAASNADPEAMYDVTVAGETLRFTLDQRTHGDEWMPLMNVPAGRLATVTLHGSGSGSLSADQVRVGGGTFPLWSIRRREVVQRDLWDLAGKHYLQSQGAPGFVWEPLGSGMAYDATTRARWVKWSHQPVEPAILLSLHTNAGGGSGTVVFVRNKCLAGPDCTPRAQDSTRIADAVRERVVAVMSSRQPDWRDGGTLKNDFAEISESINPETPAVLVEFGFHDHPRDAALLVDPTVRRELAEAVTSGVLAWWATQPQAMAPLGSQ